ncbi:hypothetical protein cypCar_00046968 [Cyprinus carpio]|nr:hypothetical protein cypCar_00046968 [Cyprinus carpio]
MRQNGFLFLSVLSPLLLQSPCNPEIQFYLNSYDNKESVLSYIRGLKYPGGYEAILGATLEEVADSLLGQDAGGRAEEGVPQVLVVISAGKSTDDVSQGERALKLASVYTFGIAVGDSATAQLEAIATDKSFVLSAPDARTVASIGLTNTAIHYGVTQRTPCDSTISQKIFKQFLVFNSHSLFFKSFKVTEKPGPSGGERDVAFLIDGSDDVRSDFPYIRDFISKVIDPLDIGFDKVRVSVVQHSERPSPNFYLNTYQTKDEVLRAVSGLTLAGGRSLNTGAALTFMKNTILSPANGGRASKNVPQFLIVLTGGRSRDSVREPAVALKTEGVVPFGVGVKNADPKQIEDISHNPSFAFNVKEFSQLSTVQERLNNYVNIPDQVLKIILDIGKKILAVCVAVVFCMLAKAAVCVSGLFFGYCAILCF